MKVSPMASNAAGQPGQSLNSVNVGQTASPMKLERARALARGERLPDVAPENTEQPRPDVRRLKMKTNFTTNRDMPLSQDAGDESLAEATPGDSASAAADPTQSSNTDTTEQGAVEATQPLSPQFAALAKQKRAFQLEKAEFEKQKAETLAASSGQGLEDLKARAASDPMGVLQDLGVTYDALTEAILSDKQQDNPRIMALEQQIKALKEGVDKTFQTNEQRQEEAALSEMLNEAESLAKEGDAYEMIRSEDAYEDVLRLIHTTYKDTGRVLDVSEAMNTIENKLLARAEKLASINKVRNKIAPPANTAAPQQQNRGMRTLTARDTATPIMDRRARAIAAAMGTLKR